TESVPLAAGFGAAAVLAADLAPVKRVAELRDRFEQRLAERVPDVSIHGATVPRVGNTSSVELRGCDGEAIVIALDLAGVAVSTGSACSSGRLEPSHVLLAMGVSGDDARSTIRVSLSRFTTIAEIDRLVELLSEAVSKNRGELAAGPGRAAARLRESQN
ncbi:MAG: aminotransferase class V-fold PLP-dependent enzyme, partial [Thermoanaerobaculia bacterium]